MSLDTPWWRPDAVVVHARDLAYKHPDQDSDLHEGCCDEHKPGDVIPRGTRLEQDQRNDGRCEERPPSTDYQANDQPDADDN